MKIIQPMIYIPPANAAKAAGIIVNGKAILEAKVATAKTAKAMVTGKGTILDEEVEREVESEFVLVLF